MFEQNNDQRPTDLPEWLNQTPEQADYWLMMDNPAGGTPLQEVRLSREEFIDLKQHLAEIRGHIERTVPVPGQEWNAIVDARNLLEKAISGTAEKTS